MGDQEQKGRQLIQEAQKKMSSPAGRLSSFFGGAMSSKLEEASDLYVRAGNCFKVAKKWSLAGQAFCDAGLCQTKMDTSHNAAQHYVDAGKCFCKCDCPEAIRCYTKAVDLLTSKGRFSMAAKHHITMAELYETNILDVDKAVEHYQIAGDYYDAEQSTASANKCYLKVAQNSAKMEHYERAIEIYEKIGTASIDSTLLKWGAKEHFFRAALCHMCVDVLNGQHALNRYEEMFPAFIDSRECTFLKKLLIALEEESVEDFTEIVRAHDKISRLDPWFTTMLLRIKRSISEEPDLR
ncbi:PREDICTED: alpha-soluble NSF attachment protein-like [Priapulus caudatus]|uniref:Alpha-soluble NSF attachment protein-like n=1 Tax=Priapulus caudatus TaxID=37621 RepID=A0ABM1EZP4_PRICU|nr:PREDICTED: alpha-soluble NSF attachment protein-like [Priapulus caudatus]